MEKIDYNNIKFEQFLEFLPHLTISYHVDLDLPEIFLATFPVFDHQAEEACMHVVSFYREVGEKMIVQPLGLLNRDQLKDWSGIVYSHEECSLESAMLCTGRYFSKDKIAISSIQDCIAYPTVDAWLPYSIQEAGEELFDFFSMGRSFAWVRIGDKLYQSAHKIENIQSGNNVTVQGVDSPPM